jgi:hypothetical protein
VLIVSSRRSRLLWDSLLFFLFLAEVHRARPRKASPPPGRDAKSLEGCRGEEEGQVQGQAQGGGDREM